jgi:hypothetical protein
MFRVSPFRVNNSKSCSPQADSPGRRATFLVRVAQITIARPPILVLMSAQPRSWQASGQDESVWVAT